jgi:hypothetical protein
VLDAQVITRLPKTAKTDKVLDEAGDPSQGELDKDEAEVRWGSWFG